MENNFRFHNRISALKLYFSEKYHTAISHERGVQNGVNVLVDDLGVLLILGFHDVLVYALSHLWGGVAHALGGVLVRNAEHQHRGCAAVTEVVESSGDIQVLAVPIGDAVWLQRDDSSCSQVGSVRLDNIIVQPELHDSCERQPGQQEHQHRHHDRQRHRYERHWKDCRRRQWKQHGEEE